MEGQRKAVNKVCKSMRNKPKMITPQTSKTSNTCYSIKLNKQWPWHQMKDWRKIFQNYKFHWPHLPIVCSHLQKSDQGHQGRIYILSVKFRIILLPSQIMVLTLKRSMQKFNEWCDGVKNHDRLLIWHDVNEMEGDYPVEIMLD